MVRRKVPRGHMATDAPAATVRDAAIAMVAQKSEATVNDAFSVTVRGKATALAMGTGVCACMVEKCNMQFKMATTA